MTDHADVIREGLSAWNETPDQRRYVAALDALVAERDELRQERLDRFVWKAEDGVLLHNDNEAAYETRDQLLARAEAAEAEVARLRAAVEAAEWLVANRGHRGEQHAWELLEKALDEVQR